MFITWTTCQVHSNAHFTDYFAFQSVSQSKLWRRAFLKLYFWLFYIVAMRFPFDQNFRNFRNGCIWHGNPRIWWISKMRTIEAKIPEIPATNSNETKIPGSKFTKARMYLRACPLFWKREKYSVPWAPGNLREFNQPIDSSKKNITSCKRDIYTVFIYPLCDIVTG